MEEKNLLLLSMSTLPPTLKESYYEGDYGERCYFRGVSQLEAGTKYYLRKLYRDGRKIDKIFIVESPESQETYTNTQGKSPSEFINHPTQVMPDERSYTEMSAVDFYKERIYQYIQGHEKVTLPVQEEKGYIFKILRKSPRHYLDVDQGILKHVRKYEKEAEPLSGMYPDLDPNMFFNDVDRKKEEDNLVRGETGSESALFSCINDLCNKIQAVAEDGSMVNLFVDEQGGGRSATFIINAAVKMLELRNIRLEESIGIDWEGSNNKKGKFNKIVDTTMNDRIFDMVSGMNEFIKTGRGDTLLQYINNSEEIDMNQEHGIIESIKEISDSISLCDVSDFDKSIQSFRSAVDNYDESKHPNSLFATFTRDLREDYGRYRLLDGDNTNTIDQIRWCLEKGLYQQALTLVEAKIPDIISEQILYYGDDINKLEDLINKAMNLRVSDDEKVGKWKHLKKLSPPSYLVDTIKNRNKDKEDEAYENENNTTYVLKAENTNYVWVKYVLQGSICLGNDNDSKRILNNCLDDGWPFLPRSIQERDFSSEKLKKIVDNESNIRSKRPSDPPRRDFILEPCISVDYLTESHKSMCAMDEDEIVKLLISYHALCDIRNNVNHADVKDGLTVDDVRNMIEVFVNRLEILLKENKHFDFSKFYPLNSSNQRGRNR